MIHTDRQLAKTREQVELLRASIVESVGAPMSGIDPVIAEASRAAVVEQARELEEEILEYELLKQGAVAIPDLREVQHLHTNLIRARIALGLTQRELAERLDMAEQQIQRYEANEYAGASLSRLREVAAALVQDDGQSPAVTEIAGLRSKLKAARLSSTVIDRLVPSRPGAPGGFGEMAARAARALGVTIQDLLDAAPLDLAAGAPAYKLPASANAESVLAYSTYAHHVAESIVSGALTGSRELPKSPDEVRDICKTEYGGLTLRSLLELAWDCGVVIVPLGDPGEFHAAFWMIDGRPVIVLKQRVRSEDRWIFDLAHELCHVADHLAGRGNGTQGLVDVDTVEGWADDPRERRANRYAGRVSLGPNADALASQCADLAEGRAERMKRSVETVARQNGLSPGALANYVAFRLASEGINWWPSASNLQATDSDPWSTARDVMLARLDLARLDEVSRALLIQAMAE
jgi:transcriptional regulator with XRE-family HTH domain